MKRKEVKKNENSDYVEIMNNDDNLKTNEVEIEINAKLSKDEKAELLNYSSDKKTVGYLVSQYYQSQQYRIRADNQIRMLVPVPNNTNITLNDNEKPNHPAFIQRQLENAKKQEALNKKYIDVITDNIPICRWLKSITGIGPVLAACIYTSFDIKIADYATDFLSYAGLNDNNVPWLGKEKARILVKEAIQVRDRSFNQQIVQELENICKNVTDNETQISTYISEINSRLLKLGQKKAKENVFIYDTKHSETAEQIIALSQQRISYLELQGIIFEVIEDDSAYKFYPDDDILTEYFNTLIHSNYCGPFLMGIVSSKCKRKLSNIMKGVINNTKNKTKNYYPTVASLEAFLAKPPYNTDLKQKMFLIGDMFIKNSNRDKSLYGKIFKQRKLEETIKNENYEYRDQAEKLLSTSNYDKTTETYKYLSEGKLSPSHISSRARRYAVKLFISHVFEAMYYAEYHENPPMPYIIAIGGHHDYIAPEVDYRPFIDGE